MIRVFALAVAALLFGAAPALAQPMGSGLSGPTDADNAAAYLNPAAMGRGEGTRIELTGGVNLIDIEYASRSSGTSSLSPISPTGTLGGFTDALHPAFRLGLSVGIPRTTGGEWKRSDGAGDITRYYMADATGFHVSIVPAFSVAPVDWLSVGGGVNLVYGQLGSKLDKDLGSLLNQTIGSSATDSPFAYAHPDLAAPVEFDTSGFGVGAIFGVLVEPLDALSIGFSFHTPVSLEGTGDLTVEYSDTLVATVNGIVPSITLPELSGSITVDLDVPWQLLTAVAVRPIPELEVQLAYRFEHSSDQPNWNLTVVEATSTLVGDTVKPQGYQNRHVISGRVKYDPVADLEVAVIGLYQTGIVPKNLLAPNNIDFDRVEIGLAARWRVVEAFSLMLQYSHLELLENDVDQSLHRPLAEPSLAAFNHPSPTGTYGGSAELLRLGLTLHL